MPEEPAEQERFKCHLIATTRSLKKKQQQLQGDQDLLNERWTDVLAAEEYGLERPTKSYPKRKLLPQFDDEALEPVPSSRNVANRPPRGRDKVATQAEHQPVLPRRKGRDKTAWVIHMTDGRTWTVEQVRPDQSTDRGGVPRRAKMAI